ncbi:MAG: ADP-ribosylglycohydrolase family protein [Acidobacteria bacterium]|nr:ADP-ribosylglycohydrolase family protein [Acidobacteriota bacterium]
MNLYERYTGTLVGLAVGDALGAPYEGRSPGGFEPSLEMSGGGVYEIEPGQWSGNTSMALCLASSLLKCRGFQPRDQMDRYLRWLRQGYLSSNGRAFGAGRTVLTAIERHESGGPAAGAGDAESAGNGSLARLAPIPMYLLHDGARTKELAARMCQTTDEAVDAVDACRYMAGLMTGALRGESKEALLADLYSPVYNYWLFQQVALCPRIDAVARGVYKHKSAGDLPAGEHAIDTLEAVLWAFFKTDDFAAGALLVVSLGNNTGTTSAVYGQLAGAYYGYTAIPEPWREKIARRNEIEDLAVALLHETKQSIRHFT